VQGLLKSLQSALGGGNEELQARGVVIGYDHRALGSVSSARLGALAAAVCSVLKVKTYLYTHIVSTPMVPFCVKHLKAAAGIMVTASHNPKEDNGYKVYWGNGAQIIPPIDHDIASLIEENLEPWDAALYAETTVASASALPTTVDPEESADVVNEYFRCVSTMSRLRSANSTTSPVVYTAMHGVGHAFVKRSFAAFDLPEPIPVPEQVSPDPTFPTVEFPNPEEGKGALALAMRTADAAGAKLILANDPDADRLAVAEKNGEAGWYVFTGNEIGTLLADWLLQGVARERGVVPAEAPGPLDLAHPPNVGRDVCVLATTVSSKAVRAIARHYGASFEETLTGFKWLGNRAIQLRAKGSTVVLGVEEAIGFCIGDVVLDKDGVSAAAVFAEMAGELAAAGLSCLDRLTAIRRATGFFASCNKYLRVTDKEVVDAIFRRIRNEGRYILRFGPIVVENIRDLTGEGMDTASDDGRPSLPTSSSHMITFTLRNGCVITLRTSGTEPKLKWYSELTRPTADAAKEELTRVMGALMDDILTPEAFGLARPAWEIVG
jgi:phosphomannomutase